MSTFYEFVWDAQAGIANDSGFIEGNVITGKITRLGDLPAETVYLRTQDGAAVGGVDFIALNGQPLTFAAGQTDATFKLTILDDGNDAAEQPYAQTLDESFHILVQRNPNDPTTTSLDSWFAWIWEGPPTQGNNTPPSVITHDVSLPVNTSVAGSSLITSISNPAGDSISKYAFWDAGGGTGHFTLNGTTQADGQWIVVDAANLNSIQYTGGTIAGSETLYVEIYDATTNTWSSSSSLIASTTASAVAPTINVHDFSISANQSVAVSSFITSLSNPSGHSISQYAFWDAGGGAGHLTLNGTAEADGQWITVSASSLSSLQYTGGSTAGSDTIYVEVYDATTSTWSDASSLTATTTATVTGPVVNLVHNVSVSANQTIAASSFITSVSASGDSITEYAFWDAGGGSGHFVLNGAAQADGQWITVSANSLSSIQYSGGSSAGTDTLYVEVYDATTTSWSNASSLTATTTSGSSSGLTVNLIQNDYTAILRSSISVDQATSISSSYSSETQYVDSLLSQAGSTTVPAVAVEASMYNSCATSAELTKLVTIFLPAQVANASHWGLNTQVYASEALGVVFAFGNELGSTSFASTYGPSSSSMPNSAAGDISFADAAVTAIFGSSATANLDHVMEQFVSNWKAFFTANGVAGIASATPDQMDLAARGASWGDMVGIALANNLGPLANEVTNFLYDAAQGSCVYGASLVGQPAHSSFVS